MIEEKLLIYVDELLKLQRALNRKGVQAVYLKGITQYYFLTGRWPKIHPVDIDILIPNSSFSKVNLILKSLGYSKHRFYQQPSLRPQINFVKKLPRATIVCDIHNQIFFPTKYIFNVLPPKLVKRITSEFIRRAQSIIFQRNKFLILENEDMLLHQCLNFFFHHSCRNQHQSFDISLITRNLDINWEIVISRLASWNLKEFAYYPLLLSKQTAKANVPNSVLLKLKPKNILSSLVPLFINSHTVKSPIRNMHLRFRYNIFLRLLIANQSILQKIQAFLLLIISPMRSRAKE
ncbi:nucleotidyltransferase family protein [Candidatus Collierbacteria bacterium]|nr:nucleotidyltransferase family protein [Candidatus Collierbacteria bacterium]